MSRPLWNGNSPVYIGKTNIVVCVCMYRKYYMERGPFGMYIYIYVYIYIYIYVFIDSFQTFWVQFPIDGEKKNHDQSYVSPVISVWMALRKRAHGAARSSMHHLSDKNPKNAPFIGLWSVQSSQRPDYEAWSHAAVHQNSDASAGSNMRNPSRQHAPYVHKHQPIAPALIPERCVHPLNHTNCSSAQLTASQDLRWNHELCGCLVQSSVGEMQSLPLFMKSQLFCAIVFILVVKTDSWSLVSLGSKTIRGTV